ncbi:MAG: hypothetical protein AB1646_10555 [Thermodesulfobacteriota bacterium]
MTVVSVDAGACGFGTRIIAHKAGPRSVRIEIDSECEAVTEFGELLTDLAPIELKDFLSTGLRDNCVCMAASASIPHSACPVAVAVIKAAEVELGLNVPSDVTITFEKS